MKLKILYYIFKNEKVKLSTWLQILWAVQIESVRPTELAALVGHFKFKYYLYLFEAIVL